MEIVGICFKFLISINSYLERIFYKIVLRLLYYCNIRFLCKIRKVIRNITINILGHEGKKL